jgi:hypothetical protein
MEGYLNEGKLFLAATNVEEFKSLIDQANKEAWQLKETIDRLKNFDICIELKTQKAMQGERMELKEIPTNELVNELQKRAGVNSQILEPYVKEHLSVEGPAIVLTVID